MNQTPEQHADLGFSFNAAELTDLGVEVQLDWDRGIELISPIPGSTATVAASVAEFLDRHGDGIYTVVIPRPTARTVASPRGCAEKRTDDRDGIGPGHVGDELATACAVHIVDQFLGTPARTSAGGSAGTLETASRPQRPN